jgi:hypothetical protein
MTHVSDMRKEWEERIATYPPGHKECETKWMNEVLVPKEREYMIEKVEKAEIREIPELRREWEERIATYPPKHKESETQVMNEVLVSREIQHMAREAGKLEVPDRRPMLQFYHDICKKIVTRKANKQNAGIKLYNPTPAFIPQQPISFAIIRAPPAHARPPQPEHTLPHNRRLSSDRRPSVHQSTGRSV